MSFRGIETTVIQIRRKVFTEVARMSYANVKGEEANHMMRQIPYTIVPGEVGKLRRDIFLERAIVEERVRLAMGLPLRRIDEHNSAVSGLEDATIADKYYDPPLVNIIKFACNSCPEKLVKVSNMCQGCLAHPCMEVCPKDAITFASGRSHIDQSLCIKCGRCVEVCPYHAIVKTERPCAAACGMGAIHSDELGRADIDYNKCVSCGQCLVNCPFGAISDKGQIYQLIQSFNRGDRIYALVAPAFVNQFPELAQTGKFRAALQAVGFCDTVEVGIGADLCTVEEAKDFLREVPAEKPFMGTSCCPAWSVMAKKTFPDLGKNISMTMTPMVFTARMMKQADPEARMCFIGPCSAKKLEASRRTVRSDVDFVLTFEELAGIIEARDIDFDALEVNEEDLHYASAAGRGFAVSGGVAQAVADKIHEWYPDKEVKITAAQSLAECKKMLMLAKAGKFNGYLLEGMACPGGCIGGAGTIADPARTAGVLAKYKSAAPYTDPEKSPFINNIHFLKDDIDQYEE
jgi:[FeFe] hydrogenase (group B1/B3)